MGHFLNLVTLFALALVVIGIGIVAAMALGKLPQDEEDSDGL